MAMAGSSVLAAGQEIAQPSTDVLGNLVKPRLTPLPSNGKDGNPAWETYPQPGPFIMALARDGSGNVWAGTEGNGVWQFIPYVITNQWKQFTTKDGLGDDYAYSVAVDQQGRIWAGHLNHGVSVYSKLY